MKLTAWIAALMLAGTTHAGQRVDVFVNRGETIPFETLQIAEAFAAHIISKAEVSIVWHGAVPATWKGGNRVMVVDVIRNVPPSYRRGDLGYALVFDGIHISVFYERIRQVNPSAEAFILAHVLAHEIVHLLQGVDRHSDAGLMKAHWDWRDFWNMRRSSLPFTSEDIRLIREARASSPSDGYTLLSSVR
jgi:hypothetical protein